MSNSKLESKSNTISNIIVYDLETTGLDSKKSRISQFSAIKINDNFEIIDRNCIYCKLPLDVLPNPKAYQINNLLTSTVNYYGVREDKFANEIWDIFNEPNLLIGGYNSVNFDDEFIRNLFFRNFKQIYSREIINGKFDVYILLKTIYFFEKKKYNWIDIDNNTSFKLENFCKANGIEHIAHDSYTDSLATIETLKLLKERSSQIFQHYFDNLSKTKIKYYIENSKTKLFYCNSKGKVNLIRIIAKDDIPNQYICCTLENNWVDDLELWNRNIFKMNINKCPFLKHLDVDMLNDLNKQTYKKITEQKTEIINFILSKKYDNLTDSFTKIYEISFKKYSNKILTQVETLKKYSKLFNDDILDTNLFRYLEAKKDIKKMSLDYKKYCLNTLNNINDNCDISFEQYYNELKLIDSSSELYKDLFNYGKYLEGILNA